MVLLHESMAKETLVVDPSLVQLPLELRQAALYMLIDYCSLVTPPVQVPFTYSLDKLERSLVTYSTSLGLKIITWLKKVGLFSENIPQEEEVLTKQQTSIASPSLVYAVDPWHLVLFINLIYLPNLFRQLTPLKLGIRYP